ncbi:MAG: phosphate acetyltransferase [Candidatus Omnitrophica bacterium]|nr:phosphate acetyltransferase [Candidatus Omnitrophota bacterium]
MTKIESIIERAKKNPKRIVLPETDDERVQKAAKRIKSEKIAEIVDSSKYSASDEIAKNFYELRKHKGVTEQEAKATIAQDPLYLAAMMTRMGLADGFVAGASRMTKDVIRAAIHCIDIERSAGIISGAFVMELERSGYGAAGLFIFADCAVIPEPSAKQLARIAVSSGDFLKLVFCIEPKIAFLTYSSRGSAAGESIDRAREAVAKVREKRPDFTVDGELQLDAAIVPEVCRRKSPDSPLKGETNVLIFPNLDAGNITYKAVERLGNAKAVGPALLGLAKPCSDLSRGCNADDIVNAVALTVVRAQLGI